MNKKSMDMNMFGILIGAIVVIIVAGSVIWIVKGGLFNSQQNVVYLSSCKNQGGTCRPGPDCLPGETGFYKNGCPEVVDGKIKDAKSEYCCIKKDNA